MIKNILRQFYYFFYDILSVLRNLYNDKNFIVILPRSIALLFKKVFIYDKLNKCFFIQNVRNKYDILTVFEIFSEESYRLNNLKHWTKINKKYLSLRNLNKKPMFIDCGSNIGSSTEYFSRIFKDIYCVLVEPNHLSNNFAPKNLSNKNHHIINKAVSFEKKIVKLNIDTKDTRASKIDKNGKDIETETIDNILNNNIKYTPFIIKIDIEGFENDLFYDNYEWINKFEIIFIEIHDWMIPHQSISHNFLVAMCETMKNNFKRDVIISGENLILIKNNNNEIYKI